MVIGGYSFVFYDGVDVDVVVVSVVVLVYNVDV